MIVVGKPSARLAETLESDEKTRIENQIRNLGPEGLEQAKKELENAKAEHDRPIPEQILTEFGETFLSL